MKNTLLSLQEIFKLYFSFLRSISDISQFYFIYSFTTLINVGLATVGDYKNQFKTNQTGFYEMPTFTGTNLINVISSEIKFFDMQRRYTEYFVSIYFSVLVRTR